MMTRIFWDLIEMGVAQYCECAKCHGVVPFQMVDFALCELYQFCFKERRFAVPTEQLVAGNGLGSFIKEKDSSPAEVPICSDIRRMKLESAST